MAGGDDDPGPNSGGNGAGETISPFVIFLGRGIADTAIGGILGDMLAGGLGDDTVFGDEGNDLIFGHQGRDVLNGGAGNDTIHATAGDGDDAIHGGDGIDTIDYQAITAALSINLATGSATSAQSGQDTLSGIENVKGGAGADVILASTVANVLDGGGGNDVFVFTSAAAADGDTIEGFAPGDTIEHVVFASAVVEFLAFGFGGWAAMAKLSGAVIAPGTFVVERNVKKVQHSFGGIVSQINVKNGDHVQSGQILLRLDATQISAELGIIRSQLTELVARGARLAAERDGAPALTLPPAFAEASADAGETGCLRRTGECERARRNSSISGSGSSAKKSPA